MKFSRNSQIFLFESRKFLSLRYYFLCYANQKDLLHSFPFSLLAVDSCIVSFIFSSEVEIIDDLAPPSPPSPPPPPPEEELLLLRNPQTPRLDFS